jgi:uracil-DNA glycosylase family 4
MKNKVRSNVQNSSGLTTQELAYTLWWYRQQGVTEAWGLAKDKNVLENSPPAAFHNLEVKLASLYEEIQNFKECPLVLTAQNTVFSDGNPQGGIMVIGEAPGADEDRLGKPFVGLSGQLLDNIFRVFGWNRENYLYITNIVPWRPPFNRQPSVQEIDLCLPFVERHIGLIQPRLLVMMGSVACRGLMRSTHPIGAMQRQRLVYSNTFLPQLIPAVAFYHPAYLLRSPGQKRVMWERLLDLKAFLKSTPHLRHFVDHVL